MKCASLTCRLACSLASSTCTLRHSGVSSSVLDSSTQKWYVGSLLCAMSTCRGGCALLVMQEAMSLFSHRTPVMSTFSHHHHHHHILPGTCLTCRYCKRCEPHSTIRSTKVKCFACPRKHGALKLVSDETFVHVVCALWLNGISFGDGLSPQSRA